MSDTRILNKKFLISLPKMHVQCLDEYTKAYGVSRSETIRKAITDFFHHGAGETTKQRLEKKLFEEGLLTADDCSACNS